MITTFPSPFVLESGPTAHSIDVLVPHGREVAAVVVDGVPAQLLTEHYPSGFGFAVQTWQAMLPRRPREITILFDD